MQITSGEDGGLGCQSVYRVLGVFEADINFYIRDMDIEREDFEFDGVLTGSSALAIHADRNDVSYATNTKDIDIYTNVDMADLETMEDFPHAQMSRENGSQYRYNTNNASTSTQIDAFVDIITDYQQAFEWDEQESNEVQRLLEEEISDEPLIRGTTEIHLPSLDTLKKTFQYSGRDYTNRIEMIEDMQDNRHDI